MDENNENNEQSTSQDNERRSPSHFLVELTSLDELAFPANSTKRVKYTCVASTSRSLILGTSTGSVYIFSRYAAKSRSRVHSPVPVHVFTTRDGQINTISMSSSEEMMAIGGDSGRVSVAQMNNGQAPTLVYTIPGDARAPDKVTSLIWSNDHKMVYSGHSSGNILVHRLGNRSVFRASHQKLTKFDGEVVQMDLYNEHIVVSTTMAAFLYHIESGTIQQIGKKPRSSPAILGACYVNPGGFIITARPNGRLWESNLVGVVYKTHQFRQCRNIPRAPPISFRNSFPTDYRMFEGIHPENQDVMLNILRLLKIEGKNLVLSAYGARICIVDLDLSNVILVTELEHDILDVTTCANDVFVLLSDSKGLRKFSLFEKNKAIEKLQLKSLYLQCGQTIQFCWPFVDISAEACKRTIEGIASMSKKKETECLQQKLNRILEEIVEKSNIIESTYDNLEEKKILSEKMASGVHKVIKNTQESGYDDDFSFNTPQALRERSRSSPCPVGKEEQMNGISKRGSEPSNIEMIQEWRKNGTPDVVEEDILNRARNLLDADGRIIEKESLRTLLQLEGIKKEEIRFTPTVTIGNAAKALAELALAVPVDVSTIWKNSEIEDETETEGDSGMESGRIDKKKPKNKATIVKIIRPGVKPKPVAIVTAERISVEDVTRDMANNQISERLTEAKSVGRESLAIAEEMKRKQDEIWLDLRLNHLREQNMEEVKKSDTEETLTTDDTEITPSVEENVEIWTNPLNDCMTPTNDEISKLYCAECRMHRSWAALALLVSICGQAEVIKDDFERGGVPSTIYQWEKILIDVAEEEEKDGTAICPRCETVLSGVDRVIADGWRNTGIVNDDTKPNIDKIYERCMKIPEEKLITIISRKNDVEENGKLSNSKEKWKLNITEVNKNVPSESTEVKYATVVDPITKKDETKILKEDIWKWTKGIRLKTILALALFCNGKKMILDIIAKNENRIGKKMEADDWSMIVVMSSKEVSFKSLISQTTIEKVLNSVNAGGWVIPKRVPNGKSNIIGRRGSNIASLSSWIVDTNGKCPICTLSIRMIVGGMDRGIVSYSCGHVYHKMCLNGKYSISGCVACRVRARRAAIAARQTGVSSPTASRSPILGTRMVK